MLLVRNALLPVFHDRRSENEAIFSDALGMHALSGSSVRGLFAAYLKSRSSSSPKHVIFTAITLEDMARIAKTLGFTVSSIGIDEHDQKPDLKELTAELAGAPGSIVVLTPLFGAMVDYTEAIRICRRYGAEVIIDNAQGFRGIEHIDYTDYDTLFWSFGPIKTMTALGGGVALVPDAERAARMRATLNDFAPGSVWRFRSRTLKYLVLDSFSRPGGFTFFIGLLKLLRINPTRTIKKLTRAYSSNHDIVVQVSRRPVALQQRLLNQQIKGYPIDDLLLRISYGRRTMDRLGADRFFGCRADRHSFWLVPLLCGAPEKLAQKLAREGFHASSQTSVLKVLDPKQHRELKRHFDRILYLPIDPTLPEAAFERLLKLIEDDA